ncbi:uncharacterized protein N7498_010663 [Penicillium cinerascens]|uniref:Uncharacterized protein n=1 Tax=Penicillium cinerascens TaxID=70096 RepID=A0A9W9M7E4_9EURO|nr:uncharacterized protein N7498_010663 [Penicillium cinerascens]KAJ5191678.1 hypothetical protein N7498_010663 [Penicillium cinerascens]
MPFQVLLATVDISTPTFVIAALLRNRVGILGDLDVFQNTDETVLGDEVSNFCPMPAHIPTSLHYYYHVCSSYHPPRTVTLCPGRRCVVFGRASGVELHWVDETNYKDQRKHFRMSQSSEVVYIPAKSPGDTDGVAADLFGWAWTDVNKGAHVPTTFAAGSDLSWGLRVIAAYQDRVVLYTVPLDVFNIICKERELQGDSVVKDSDLIHGLEFLLSVSYKPTAMMRPFQ